MILLGHLSDPHLGPLPSARMRDLAGKRAIGFVNWHRRRKTIHRGEVLSRIVSDLKAHNPDHIAVTGDILNIALPGEFAPSRVWLDTVGPAHDVTFVPGNHDAYVRKAAREWHSHWGDFMKRRHHRRRPVPVRAAARRYRADRAVERDHHRAVHGDRQDRHAAASRAAGHSRPAARPRDCSAWC